MAPYSLHSALIISREEGATTLLCREEGAISNAAVIDLGRLRRGFFLRLTKCHSGKATYQSKYGITKCLPLLAVSVCGKGEEKEVDSRLFMSLYWVWR